MTKMDAGVAVHDGLRSSAMLQDTPIVFVADDDVSVRESVELLICNAGWRSETVECTQEFLRHEQVLVPSCLVLDIATPGLDGRDIQRRLAADGKEMPIIFLADHGDVAMAVQAMKAGAFDFLTKPVCDDALLSAGRRSSVVGLRLIMRLKYAGCETATTPSATASEK